MFSRVFYNRSIRNLVVGFGSVFNNIHVRRFNVDGTEKQDIRLPLVYAPKDIMYRQLTEIQSTDRDETQMRMTAPRLSYEIVGMQYDAGRQFNPLMKRHSTRSEDSVDFTYNHVEVPYNIQISLHAFVKYIDDGLQVIEQIVPYFTPNFNMSLNMTDIGQKINVPMTMLTGPSTNWMYEGDMTNSRMIIHSFTFNCQSVIFGPTIDTGLIREVDINLLNYDLLES